MRDIWERCAVCNLYSMTTGVEAIRQLFKVTKIHSNAGNLPALSSIFPAYDAPVIRPDGKDRELKMMHWGFILPQKDRAPKAVTNARGDKVTTSPFWKSSFAARRCLVPATSFAEPKGRKPAIWHWFGMKGDLPRPPFAFAGIWRTWHGPYKGETRHLEVFAILTTTPNDIVRPIHPNRMPVILAETQYDTWLQASPEDAIELAKPFPAANMHIVHKGETKDPG